MKNFLLEFTIALRYLRGQGRTVIFSPGIRLSLVFMAVMVYILVLVLSVFNGFQEEIFSILEKSGYHIKVSRSPTAYSISRHIKNYDEIIDIYNKNKKLKPLMDTSFPLISINALLEIKGRFVGKNIQALRVEKTDDPMNPIAGQYRNYPPLVHYKRKYLDKFSGGNYILVGRKLARENNWKLGSRVRVYLPEGGQLARNIQIEKTDFIVAGLFRTGFNEFDGNIVYTSLKTAQRIIGMRDQVNQIIVQVKDLGQLDQAKEMVRDLIPGNPYLYEFTTIRDERGNFLDAVQLEKALMSIVLGLLIIAGAAGILVTIFLLVQEKTRSIGMLRAMGLPSRSINMIFTVNAMLIGLIATALGGGLGIVAANNLENIIRLVEDIVNSFCTWPFMAGLPGFPCKVKFIPENIYYFDYLPVRADLNTIFAIALITVILSGFAGFIPSRAAAGKNPVDSLRGN